MPTGYLADSMVRSQTRAKIADRSRAGHSRRMADYSHEERKLANLLGVSLYERP